MDLPVLHNLCVADFSNLKDFLHVPNMNILDILLFFVLFCYFPPFCWLWTPNFIYFERTYFFYFEDFIKSNAYKALA